MIHDYNTWGKKQEQDKSRFKNEGYGEQYTKKYKLPERWNFKSKGDHY